MIDFNDFDYAMPGEHLRTAADYDLRTGPERAAAQLDDHQRRIAELEQRLRHVETLVHLVINRAESSADGV